MALNFVKHSAYLYTGKGVIMQSVVDIAARANGYVTAENVTELGIPRRKLADAVRAGELVHVARGLYALPETWEDPFYITQYRFARGVFSDDTALYLHGMTDRVPFSLTMTFPRSYNATNAREAGINCRSCAEEVHDLGIIEATTSYGNVVRTYDIERTLCDLVRGQQVVDTQILTPAMQDYIRSQDRNPPKLMDYARALGVERKVRTYLEVLL